MTRDNNRNSEVHMVSSTGFRLAALSVALLCGCNGGAGSASHLQIVSGNNQNGTVATPLGEPLTVKATDDNGNPVPGIAVTWTADAGGGTFTSGTVNTGMDGQTQVVAILGKTAGANRFTAHAGMIMGAMVSFDAAGMPGPATSLVKVSGDGQIGSAGTALPQPLVASAQDQYGNAVPGVIVNWTVASGGGSVIAKSGTTGADGTVAASATLGPAAQKGVFQALAFKVTAAVSFSATRHPFKLSYTDPPAGGKLRLVRNSASTDSQAVLDLVVASGATLTGYSAGFNLPLDDSKVQLDGKDPMVPGKALDPGSAPVAARAVQPQGGPLKAVLVSGLSQKASGTGAVTTDTQLSAGAVLYTLKLDLLPDGATGVVFDGTAKDFVLASGGMRDRVGNTVVAPADLAIGKLEVLK